MTATMHRPPDDGSGGRDNYALSLSAITKKFGTITALKHVDFQLRPGEVHALMGENGAGKSTLVKVMAGMHQPTSGQIQINGVDTILSDPKTAGHAGISIVHQELLLFAELSVAENIFSGAYPRRSGAIDWAFMRKRSRDLLRELDCHDLDVDRKVGTLSVAMRQRVEIARALRQDARILILDEPTAALGENDAERLLEIVKMLRGRGVAIIYVSHRMNEIFRIADRITILRDGSHVATRDAATTTEAELVALMVGRAVEQVFPKIEVPIGGPVLQVQNLTRGKLVRNATFTLHKGEILGIAGLVGAGRTELAHVLFGITPAESGSIRLNGRDLTISTPRQARDAGIAYVPEDRGHQGLVKSLSIRENISMAVLDRISPAGFITRLREAALAQRGFDLLGVRASGIEQPVGQLSGGNQQKVVIAKWLETNPAVLILDEPTRGVDVGAKSEIHRLMGEMVANGLSILMISSELPEVLAMSDRVMVIAEGQITAILNRTEATPESVGMFMSSRRGVAV